MKTAGLPSYVELGSEIAGTNGFLNKVVLADPSVGGLAGGVGSTAIQVDGGGNITHYYQKTGAADTDWEETVSGSFVPDDHTVNAGATVNSSNLAGLTAFPNLAGDPTAGAGIAAPIGTRGFTASGGWDKFGANDTDWIPSSGWITVATAPNAGAGVAARVGTVAKATDTGLCYIKSGAADTEWEGYGYGSQSIGGRLAKHRAMAWKLFGAVDMGEVHDEFCLYHGWQFAVANGGLGNLTGGSYVSSVGALVVNTAATSPNGSAYSYPMQAPAVTYNARTKKWLMAMRVCKNGTTPVDANLQLFAGLYNGTNHVGFGIDGANSTTVASAGLFAGTFPANTVSPGNNTNSTQMLAMAPALGEIIMYNDTTNLYASVNGETFFIACPSTSITAVPMSPVVSINNINGSQVSHYLYMDYLYFFGER